jgi:hypothetical protein
MATEVQKALSKWRVIRPLLVGLLLLAVASSTVQSHFGHGSIKDQYRTNHIPRRSAHISGIFPTNIQRECSDSLSSQNFEDCAHAVQWRNAKFGVVITIIGLGFIFTIGFTFMSCIRREKARRLTRFYDFTVVSGTMSPASKKPAIGNDLETALTNNHENVVLDTPVHRVQEGANTAVDGTLVTHDGANDGWTLWTSQRAGIVVSSTWGA